jgi:hypothetical protein
MGGFVKIDNVTRGRLRSLNNWSVARGRGDNLGAQVLSVEKIS